MLILSLMLSPFVVFAIDDEMQGLHEQGEAKFMTVVKDVEVERLIGSEPEFNKCRDAGWSGRHCPLRHRGHHRCRLQHLRAARSLAWRLGLGKR